MKIGILYFSTVLFQQESIARAVRAHVAEHGQDSGGN